MTKSFSTDRATLADSGADPVDRIAALQRLLADGIVVEIRSIVEPWVNHGVLRNAGLNYVLHYLYLDEYVSVALERLAKEPESDEEMEAGMAAYALGQYVAHAGRQRSVIYDSLISTLERSQDEYVQRSCYEALLRGEGDPFPAVPSEFSKETNVDWGLIARLRAR